MCSGLSWARQLQWFDRRTFTSAPRSPESVSPLRATLMAAQGPLPPPRLVPGGPAVLQCAATLGSVHLPPAYSGGQWKLRPLATASGPALPDPVPEIRSGA